MKKRPLTERFWSKVDVRGPDECWPWTAATAWNGYGRIGSGGRGEGTLGAHRVAWASTNGKIPDGLCVLHICDNPPCCNPQHLFLGTQADNLRDCAAKGRSADTRGEKCSAAKLTTIGVRLIRYWLSKGYMQKEIADTFGVSRPTISNINRGYSWSHI